MAKKEFQAESKKLMDMMINSIYTNKEIFLRELISNASDAIDKLYYKSLTDTSVGMNKSDFRILITRDKENRILTVEDNGIGMTKAELEENLGTIAHSGSLDFKQDNKDENIDIIGQFGVGFYSSFMVADKVTVISKAYGSDEAWQWESSGVDGYEMTPAEKDTAGTQIILHIKPDTETDHYDNFLDEYGIVAIVKKYSDYVRYPIQMERQHERQKPEPGISRYLRPPRAEYRFSVWRKGVFSTRSIFQRMWLVTFSTLCMTSLGHGNTASFTRWKM